jgi:hypothetical protein
MGYVLRKLTTFNHNIGVVAEDSAAIACKVLLNRASLKTRVPGVKVDSAAKRNEKHLLIDKVPSTHVRGNATFAQRHVAAFRV